MQALVGRCACPRFATLQQSRARPRSKGGGATRRGPAINAACASRTSRVGGALVSRHRWDLVSGQTPQRFQRGLDVYRARRRVTQTQTSNARPSQTSPQHRDDSRAHRNRSRPAVHRNPSPVRANATRAARMHNARSTRRRDPGRASLEARPAAWHRAERSPRRTHRER